MSLILAQNKGAKGAAVHFNMREQSVCIDFNLNYYLSNLYVLTKQV